MGESVRKGNAGTQVFGIQPHRQKSMLLDRDFLNSAPGLYTDNSGSKVP